MAQRLGVRGTSTAGAAPPTQTRLKYDRSDRILMKSLADAPALHITIKKAKKRPTSSFKFYMYEDDYEVFSFELEGADAVGADAALATSTIYFKSATKLSEYLQAKDILHISLWDENQTGVIGTGDGASDGTAALAGENIIVESFVNDYVIRVTRQGGAGTQAYNVTGLINTLLTAEHIGNAMEDGSLSPDPISQSLEEDYNYLQNMRITWSVSNRNQHEEMYGGSDLQLEARRKRLTLFRRIERSFWTGSRYARYSGSSLVQSFTGGILPYVIDLSATHTRVDAYDASGDLVKGDGTQQMWLVNKNFSINNWNKFLEKAFKYGTRNSKVGYGGRGFITEFENMYEGKFGAFDYDVDQFGFAVAMAKNTFGILPIAVEQEFSTNNAGYNFHFVVVDHDYVWYRFGKGACSVMNGQCGYSNTDIHVHQNIQARDAAYRKDELYVDFGWDQKHRNAHSWLAWDGTH